MNRLWVRLTLAFALVILVTVGVIALLADLTASHAFRRYLSYSDSALHQTLVERLSIYYQENGSWQGVGSFLGQIGGTSISRLSWLTPVGAWSMTARGGALAGR